SYIGKYVSVPGAGSGNVGAGEGNRTLVISLEGFCSTIELHPPEPFSACPLPRPCRSHCLVEGEGFEPSKAEPSDLQSDPFDRSGTPPNETADYAEFSGPRQRIVLPLQLQGT